MYAQKTDLNQNVVQDEVQFNGYTNYWHDSYDRWLRYGNLFKMSLPDISASIAQSKADIAEDMEVPGLSMQEGFMNGLINGSFTTLDQPSVTQIEQAVPKGNLLILLDPDSEAGKKVAGKFSGSGLNKDSHQLGAKDLVKVNAFFLQKDKRKIFVITSNNSNYRTKVKELIDNTLKIVKDNDLHRGWFGQSTLFRTDTISPAHRLEVIGKGMNEGNDWFVFSGSKEYLAKKEIADNLSKINLPVVTDVGYSSIYGLKNYDGLQTTWGDSALVKFAHEREGYAFHQVVDTIPGYDGFTAGEGNKKQLDNEDVPFIPAASSQGSGRQMMSNLESGFVPTMVLFVKKGEKFTREVLWQSILLRKEVAVGRQGKMMGPALYRNAVNMLSLDREFLEEYFGDRVNMDAVIEGNQLKVNLKNTYSHPVSGNLSINLPAELKINGSLSSKVDLPVNGTKTITYQVLTSADAVAKVNPVAVHYNWGSSKKSTIAINKMKE